MRVAVVGPTHPFKGGIAQHTTELATRLRGAGHDVQLVSWLRQYPHALYRGQQFVPEPELPVFASTTRELSWNRPDTWVRAGRRLRDVELVVIAHATPVQVPAYRAMIAALGGEPRVVIIAHNVLPHERSRVDRPLVRGLFDAADRIVVHSEDERARAAGLTTTPLTVAALAPAPPAAFVARSPEPGEHRRLLFFGLVRPYKGLDVLLRALAAGPPDIRLRVAGEFWGGTTAWERLIDELGIGDRVELRSGYVPADDVPGLFADVDALVVPYREVTGTQIVWTGFEFGVPVIASRTGPLADEIRDGVDGLLADPGDVGSLSAALRAFYRPGVPEALRAGVRAVDPAPAWHRYVDAVTDPVTRRPQLAYSEIQAKMSDEVVRRTKARKIVKVLHDFLGRTDLDGLVAVDVGCSVGFIADELARDGARTVGVDIDRPGLRAARAHFAPAVQFLGGSGDALPLASESADIVVFNHIYEHVVDADAVLSEIHRVLKPAGCVYLGLGNKHQLIEPHYRLPLLSWLPRALADRYVRRFAGVDEYYERYSTGRGLRRLVRGFTVWDYTVPVIREPARFGSGDQVGAVAARLPAAVVRAALPIVPTYIWVASKSGQPARPLAGRRRLDLGGPVRRGR